jgi:outer membrane lipoprotein LolB
VRATALRVALAAAVLLSGLAGCRTAPQAPVIGPGPGADAPWPLQRERLETLERYSLNGRVAVAASGQGFSASLRYLQQPQRAEMALDGPMGLGGMRLTLDGDDLAVATSNGETLDGSAARDEIERRLGFSLPLAELRWWLLGIPAPGEAALEQDGVTGEIRGFRQNGWQVNVDARAPAMGFALPRRLTAQREGARLKLAVDRWQP